MPALSEDEIWGNIGSYFKNLFLTTLIIVFSYFIICGVVEYLKEIEKTKQLELQLKLKEINIKNKDGD
jgi:hypothetical protein